jgi:hypothetical protein
MFKRVSFNIFEENLEETVYGENKRRQRSDRREKEDSDEPIPKPPPQFWTKPLSYRRCERKSEGAK